MKSKFLLFIYLFLIVNLTSITQAAYLPAALYLGGSGSDGSLIVSSKTTYSTLVQKDFIDFQITGTGVLNLVSNSIINSLNSLTVDGNINVAVANVGGIGGSAGADVVSYYPGGPGTGLSHGAGGYPYYGGGGGGCGGNGGFGASGSGSYIANLTPGGFAVNLSPAASGSGGGGGSLGMTGTSVSDANCGQGGSGGGVVTLVSNGLITINGTINANGTNATAVSLISAGSGDTLSGGGSGGGSGGVIKIYSPYGILGNGIISAVGGNGAAGAASGSGAVGYGGGGGGGGIILLVSPVISSTLVGNSSVSSGASGSSTLSYSPTNTPTAGQIIQIAAKPSYPLIATIEANLLDLANYASRNKIKVLKIASEQELFKLIKKIEDSKRIVLRN